jgi:hypothetical protein
MAHQNVIIHAAGRTEAKMSRPVHQVIARSAAERVNTYFQQFKPNAPWFERVTTIRRQKDADTYGALHDSGNWGQTE